MYENLLKIVIAFLDCGGKTDDFRSRANNSHQFELTHTSSK